MYNHYYPESIRSVLCSLLPDVKNVEQVTNENAEKFLQTLSMTDALIVLQDILEDDKVKQEEIEWRQKLLSLSSATTSIIDAERITQELMNENSPVYWKSKLIHMLRNNALDYDESERKFTNLGTTSPERLAAASSRSHELNETTDTIEKKLQAENNAIQKSVDVFICHAGEDKKEIALPLANKLTQLDVSVWIDKFTLRWGSSLFSRINEGLRNCRYGIVILSNSFFSKKWPDLELQALFSLMVSRGDDLILPLRPKIQQEEIVHNYPLLAGILSRSSDVGVDVLAHELVQILRQENKSEYIQVQQKPSISNTSGMNVIKRDETSTKKISDKKFQAISIEEMMSCISKN
jgi:hypothetical protein